MQTPKPFARSPCAIANSLGILGDNWSLLVVRDLLHGKRTYGELANSPERIPTNLLADRLARYGRIEAGSGEQRSGAIRGALTSAASKARALRASPVSSVAHGANCPASIKMRYVTIQEGILPCAGITIWPTFSAARSWPTPCLILSMASRAMPFKALSHRPPPKACPPQRST